MKTRRVKRKIHERRVGFSNILFDHCLQRVHVRERDRQREHFQNCCIFVECRAVVVPHMSRWSSGWSLRWGVDSHVIFVSVVACLIIHEDHHTQLVFLADLNFGDVNVSRTKTKDKIATISVYVILHGRILRATWSLKSAELQDVYT